MERGGSPLQAIHMVMPAALRVRSGGAEFAGGGSCHCLLMQSDSHGSQSGPFCQPEPYLTLQAFSISNMLEITLQIFPSCNLKVTMKRQQRFSPLALKDKNLVKCLNVVT